MKHPVEGPASPAGEWEGAVAALGISEVIASRVGAAAAPGPPGTLRGRPPV